MKLILLYIIIISFVDLLSAQLPNKNNIKFKDYQIADKMYTTDISGNLLMNINVWGAVSMPGRLTVPEGVDMATILSLVGGPSIEINYKKIIILREQPDENDRLKLVVDLTDFIKTGDRSNFVKILPNDTIIIKQKFSGYLVERINAFTTYTSILSLLISIITII